MIKTNKILSLLAILALVLAFGLSSCTKTEFETFDEVESLEADKSTGIYIASDRDDRTDDIDVDDVTDDEDDDDEEEEERRD